MKKIASLIAGLTIFASMASVGLAQTYEAAGSAASTTGTVVTTSSDCTVNGKAVPCDQALNAVGSVLGAFGWIFGVLAIVGVLGGIFWLWMLIDCLKRDFKKDSDKILWALAIFFLSLLGAALYFFMVKTADPKSV